MRMTEGLERRNEFVRRLSGESYKLSRDSVEDLVWFGRTPNGAWNRDQLEALGVSWPPVAGWKRALARRGSIPTSDVRRFLALATVPAKERKRARRTGQDVLNLGP